MLGHHKNLAALHVVSHATPGAVLLGNSEINAEQLKREVQLFAALNGSIADGGDLLLYGCDLAAGQSGEEFLDIIRNSTHLDVAASNDRTGNDEQGGNWDLEIKRGEIETDLAFSQKALMDFSGVLAPTEYTALDVYTAAGGSYYAQPSMDVAGGRLYFHRALMELSACLMISVRLAICMFTREPRLLRFAICRSQQMVCLRAPLSCTS